MPKTPYPKTHVLMKKLLYPIAAILCLSLSLSHFSFAQNCIPTIFTYQEANYSNDFTLISTSDGGYLFTGSVTTEAGDEDLHIVRVDALGNLLWSRDFGGAEDDKGKNARQTSDGGFIIVGQTKSYSVVDDTQEAWLIKTDANGVEEWSQIYDAIEANYIDILPNGKFIVAGTETMATGTVGLSAILWIARINNNSGYIENNATKSVDIPEGSLWEGDSHTYGTSVKVLENGSYLITGRAETKAEVYPKPGFFYTVKTDELFETEWEHIVSGSFFSKGGSNDAVIHSDGYYYIAGGTSQGACCDGSVFASIQKIDVNGTQIWKKNFTSVASRGNSIRELEDGNLIVQGSRSIFKIDTSGVVLWNSARLNGNIAYTSSVLDSPDGGFITLSRVYNDAPNLQLTFFDSLGNNCENRVTGRVYRDNDGDCEFNPEEDEFLSNPFVFETPIDWLYSGIQSPFAVGNTQGEYILRVDTGTVEVAGIINGQYTNRDMWDLGCPDSTYVLSFEDVNQEEDSIDFSFTPNVNCPLLRVSSYMNQVRPFVESNLYVAITNIGTENAFNVAVDVEIPDLIVPDEAAIDLPYTQVGNIYTFTLDTVHWGEQRRIVIPFITSESAMIGDTACVRTQIFQDTICGEFTGQGSHLRCRRVTNSYDPNEKILDLASGKNCLDAPYEELFYTIHFQNTGNDTAYQVVITDSLSSLLDLNSLELLSSSHDVQYSFGAEGTLIFTFSDINLLDSLTNERESQGFVEFSIFPTADFTLEQVIANRAQIYFDYNEPIITDYAYAYACTEDFLAEIIKIEYDFSCENNQGNLNISAFHPEPLLYSIDNGVNWQNSSVFLNLSPTNYAVCIQSEDGTIVHASENSIDFSSYTMPEIIDVLIENDTDCESLNGSIFIEASSISDLEYSINGGGNWRDTPHFTNLGKGTYYLLVRNNQGCESEVQEIYLSGVPYFQLDEIEITPACTDCTGRIRAYVSVSNNLTYSLDGISQSSSIFSNLCAGEHELVISQNSSGCEIVETITIDTVANFSFTNFSTNTTACEYGNNMGSIRAYTDYNNLMYFSLDGVSYNTEYFGGSHLFPNLSAGDYVIYAGNPQGCSIISDTITINALATPVIDTIESVINCEDSLGTLIVTASEGEIFSYSFNGGQSFAYQNNTQDSLEIGTYQIVVRNENSCLSTPKTAYLLSSGDVEITAVNVDLPECIENLGQIEVVTTDTLDLEYSIDDGLTWQNNAQFTDLAEGNYNVLIKNINSECATAFEANPVVIEPDAPEWTFPVLYESEFCADEQAYIFINSGNADGYEYSIDGGETWQTEVFFGNLSTGNYDVEIKNLSTGCEHEFPENPVLININEEIQFSAEMETSYCENEIGSIDISLEIEEEDKEYSIDNGENWNDSALFENLPAGLFNLFVRDINNQCISEYANNPVEVEEIGAPEIINILSTNPSNINNSDGELVVMTNGEVSMEYSIDDGTNWQTSNTFSNLEIGDYQASVRYTNGLCVVDADIITLSSTTSNYEIEELDAIFYISPNPFANNFLIECNDENSSNFYFKITDATGKTIMTREVQGVKTLIETENWGKGIYFIYLKKENGYSVQKIVKQ